MEIEQDSLKKKNTLNTLDTIISNDSFTECV